MSFNQRAAIAGFSLVELLIVMMIIAILAAISYPSYIASVTRGNRTDATRQMLQMSEALQRCYSNSFTYVGCPTAPAGTSSSPNGYYTLTLAPTASTYTITATPLAGTALNDAQCTSMSLTNASVQGATGTGGAALCWGGN